MGLGQANLSPKSIYNQLSPVTLDEMRRFVIMIHTGLIPKPRLTDYWSLDPALHTSFCAKVMPKDRFRAILSFFHIVNNENFIPCGEEGHDPVHKIRLFIDHLNICFKEMYVPRKKICIDEAMCFFKGRSRFKIYKKDKPTKWGFKFYELCESKRAYVYNFEMFCADKRLSNKPTDVTLQLMDPLLNNGYQLYIDNYYCCLELAQQLVQRKTMLCGTV
ncbi:PiggyBac transposase uribo1 [Plakobranchus ocellatus]|uniref:PiggyBac transposase uribo1 n=1 Tax=Plakobranchus ocellatus TaxID=259542 RepID=A0AAV4BIM7_9GAST|nr:PiggyBac transposase uribo1 [Plakobranchus ocellatus]